MDQMTEATPFIAHTHGTSLRSSAAARATTCGNTAPSGMPTAATQVAEMSRRAARAQASVASRLTDHAGSRAGSAAGGGHGREPPQRLARPPQAEHAQVRVLGAREEQRKLATLPPVRPQRPDE